MKWRKLMQSPSSWLETQKELDTVSSFHVLHLWIFYTLTFLAVHLLIQKLWGTSQQSVFSQVLLVTLMQTPVKACVLGWWYWKLSIPEPEEKTSSETTEIGGAFNTGESTQCLQSSKSWTGYNQEGKRRYQPWDAMTCKYLGK